MSDLTFESLYYFLILAESCHYGEAADKLFITQQALSKSIKQLEEKLGVALFRKQGRQQQLTSAGQQLQLKARILLNEVQQIETRFLPSPSKMPDELIRIGAATLPRLPVRAVIKHLLRSNPHLRFECDRPLSLAQMEQDLLEHRIDCAFHLEAPRSQELRSQVVSACPYLIVSHPDMAHLAWDQQDYIRIHSHCPVHAAHYWPAELHSRPVVAHVDWASALHLCRSGKGALFMHESAVRYELQAKRLVALPDLPFEYPSLTYMIWNPAIEADSLPHTFIRQILDWGVADD